MMVFRDQIFRDKIGTVPEDRESDPDPLPVVVPEPPATPTDEKKNEEDVGDFINRHVFEKDSVFFEG
jgi:hypothetical protein